jgi:hypothetical protein
VLGPRQSGTPISKDEAVDLGTAGAGAREPTGTLPLAVDRGRRLPAVVEVEDHGRRLHLFAAR